MPKCRAYCIYKTPSTDLYLCKSKYNCMPNTPYSGCCQHEKYFCNCGGDIFVTEVNTFTQVTVIHLLSRIFMSSGTPGFDVNISHVQMRVVIKEIKI